MGCRRGSTPQRSTGQQPFLIRHSYSLLLLPLVYSLLLISRRVLTSPDRVLELDSSPVFLVCGMPGGSRAMPSPYQGTLACPKPGTPGDFRPHVTNPLSAEF